jgi:hypothetical protein
MGFLLNHATTSLLPLITLAATGFDLWPQLHLGHFMKITIDQARLAKQTVRDLIPDDDLFGIGLGGDESGYIVVVYLGEEADLDQYPKLIDSVKVLYFHSKGATTFLQL